MQGSLPEVTKSKKRPQSALRSSKARHANSPKLPEDMSEVESYAYLENHFYAVNNGKPYCPRPGCKRCDAIYVYAPRWNRTHTTFRQIYKCKMCQHQFTMTSTRQFAYHKRTYKQILLAIWDFASAPTGHPALQLSVRRNQDYKGAWLFNHKIRQAMMLDLASIVLDGEVEIDGTEIGGYVKPKNARKEKHPKDPNRTKKNAYRHRKFGRTKCIVFVARQRNGPVRTTIVDQETEAKPWITAIVAKSAVIHADLATSFHDLAWHLNNPHDFKRINHSENFWTGECHTNNAENYNSMLEFMKNIYRSISHPNYRASFAEELAWRMTHQKLTLSDKVDALVEAIGRAGRCTIRGIWRKRPIEEVAA